MPPLVSVLLPTHNRADVVALAVRSVLDQTEADFELLIVADGCTDGTVALIERLGDARIRVFDLPKAPHFGYANRNIALREARGAFVAFAAHDDLLCPDHLEQLVRALKASGREWIYSRPLWASPDGIIVPYATNLTNRDELEDFLTVGNTIPASCVLYQRSCLDTYGDWPENVPNAADWRHWIAIIEGGQRRNLAYLPTPTCLHFSADWRHSRHAGAEEMRIWLEVADSADWWPRPLRWTIPPGVPEQRVIAEAMRAGGPIWLHDMRAAVDTAIDRLAWDDVRVVRPRLRGRDVENQQLRAMIAGRELELAAIRQDLAARQELVERNARELAALRDSLVVRETIAASRASQIATLGNHLAAYETLSRTNAAELLAMGERVAAHQVLVQSSAASLQAAEHQIEGLQQRIEVLEQDLAAVLTSNSWRMTAPMRALRRLLR